MKVEDGLSRIYIFLFDDESADIFTLVVGDSKVDTFNNMGIDDLFFGTNRVDIVWVFIRCDDTLPRPFEVFSDCFHQ